MNREVHVRIWERPEVRVLRATRHEEWFPPTRLSAGCGFRKETIAGLRRNGRDAPKPDLCAAAGERASFELLPVIRLSRTLTIF